jgi:hypothetical protein
MVKRQYRTAEEVGTHGMEALYRHRANGAGDLPVIHHLEPSAGHCSGHFIDCSATSAASAVSLSMATTPAHGIP